MWHKIFMVAIAVASSAIISASALADDAGVREEVLFSFSEGTTGWVIVNDGVMGGRSQGGVRRTEAGHLEFAGTVSLENRGGFSSVRSPASNLNLRGFDAIVIKVRGDGRMYYFDVRTPAQERFPASSYRQSIQPAAGEWQEVRLSLSDFAVSAFGQQLPGGQLDVSRVVSLGFTIADKKAGPFKIEVEWIKAVGAADSASGAKNIIETARAAGSFKTLLAAVEAAGLTDTLNAKGPFTVFAPTDDAFKKLPAGTVEELLLPENRQKLAAILTYHVLPGLVFLGKQELKTVQGATVRVEGDATVNGVKLVAKDIRASNGVIHVIGEVLLPPSPRDRTVAGARAVIALAIDRGVPLFNGGQPEACSAIYELAVTSLLEGYPDAMQAAQREQLQKALADARAESSPQEQAWILRRALDQADAVLKRQPQEE